MSTSEVKSSKPSPHHVLAAAAVAVLALAGCSGNGGDGPDSSAPAPAENSTAATTSMASDSMSPSPSESAPSSGSPDPMSGVATLIQAGRTALAKVSGSTLISIETERNGQAWEVQVVTTDGTEQEMELSADGTEVVTGPTTKNEGITDKNKHLERVQAADVDYEEAAQKMLSVVPDGQVTELNLDNEQGTTVWEADVVDGSGVKHAVQIDAASGEVLSNTADSDD